MSYENWFGINGLNFKCVRSEKSWLKGAMWRVSGNSGAFWFHRRTQHDNKNFYRPDDLWLIALLFPKLPFIIKFPFWYFMRREKLFQLFQRALIKKLPAKFTFLFYLESNLSSFKKLDKQGNKSKALTVTSDLWIFTSTLKDKCRSVSLIAVREILFRGLTVARAVLDAL